MAKSNLFFLFLRLVTGLHLVMNLLLFMVDLDNDMSPPEECPSTQLNVIKGFFMGKDPVVIWHCYLQWMSKPFYVAVLTGVSQMHSILDLTTPKVPATSLLGLFSVCSLRTACSSCSECSFDSIFWINPNSFHSSAYMRTSDLPNLWKNVPHTWP